jgi:hypothetical protein
MFGLVARVLRLALGLVLVLVVLPSPARAQAADADPAAIQMLQGNAATGSAVCGAYDLRWTSAVSFDARAPGTASLHATAGDGTVAFDLSRSLSPFERVIPLWCGDVLGDGGQELAYATYSGGAHCCSTARVVQLDPPGRQLLEEDLGNGGLIGGPQQLDGSGPLELPATSDVFAYFGDLSFAASPFLPLVFGYDGTRFVEATRQFPDYVAGQLEEAQAALDAAVARGPAPDAPPEVAYQEQESTALRLYGLHVLLGDADEVLPSIQAQVAPPVAAWLEANAAAARDALAARYDLSPPSTCLVRPNRW